MRLACVLVAGSFGLLGIACGIVLYSLYLGSIKTFGIPFLSPAPGFRTKSEGTAIFVNKVWKREKRPSFLKTKSKSAEPEISRQWMTKNNMNGSENDVE